MLVLIHDYSGRLATSADRTKPRTQSPCGMTGQRETFAHGGQTEEQDEQTRREDGDPVHHFFRMDFSASSSSPRIAVTVRSY